MTKSFNGLRTKILAKAAVFIFGAAAISFGQVVAPPPPPATPSATPEVVESDEVIKIDTELVNLLFSAQDKNRRLLTDLKASDINIFENGELQEIVEFRRQVDLPLSLSILIDTSASQERTLPLEKEAANSFLERVVRPTKDEVAIISFTGEATLEQGMTNNMGRLRRAVAGIKFVPPTGYIGGGVVGGTPTISDNRASGSTAIWDAIWVTSEEILGPAPEKTRRAIVLLSDGDNTYGLKKIEDAIRAAQKAEAVIYSIGIGDNFYRGVNQGTLKKISEETGGRAFFPKDEIELQASFRQIEEEMRSQYLVTYEPVNQARDGSFRKINIQLMDTSQQKEKIKLTYRDGYFAKTDSKLD